MNETQMIANQIPDSDALAICRVFHLGIDEAAPLIGVEPAMRMSECIECGATMFYRRALFGCCDGNCLRVRKARARIMKYWGKNCD